MSKVLLIDDEQSSNMLLKLYLEMDGFKVSTATTLRQAYEIMDDHLDAVVVDYHLSEGTNGLMLVDAVRNNETNALKDTPIIVTSGDDRLQSRTEQSAVDMFLLKPFAPTDLSKYLRQMIKERAVNRS